MQAPAVAAAMAAFIKRSALMDLDKLLVTCHYKEPLTEFLTLAAPAFALFPSLHYLTECIPTLRNQCPFLVVPYPAKLLHVTLCKSVSPSMHGRFLLLV